VGPAFFERTDAAKHDGCKMQRVMQPLPSELLISKQPIAQVNTSSMQPLPSELLIIHMGHNNNHNKWGRHAHM
jgi:hypothetical protein